VKARQGLLFCKKEAKNFFESGARPLALGWLMARLV
jgi:hypothetical protein